jgi:RHS repeat-associated protein
VTLGLQATVVENGVWQTYSARYYNPATGRFLSRDPEDGVPTDPATLHKYDYADGDPVDGTDPSGRDAVMEYTEVTVKIDIGALPALYTLGCAVNMTYGYIAHKIVDDFNIRPTLKCGVKGQGRMRIQLQFGKAGQGMTAASRTEINDDPPGVLLAQVGVDLASIWGQAQGGIPGFPKSLNYDLKTALVDVSVCANRIVAGGGVIGGEKTVCQGVVGGGWRVDLDQLNGWNLTQ